MNVGDLRPLDMVMFAIILMVIQALAIITTLYLKKKTIKMSRRLFEILLINLICAALPFGLFGIMMGLPSVILSSLLITLFLDKEKDA
jgi:hypothetical protein